MRELVHEPVQSFRLAPMSRSIRVLTLALLPLPLVLLAAAPFCGAGPTLTGAALFVGLIWAGVWTWFRPTRFELSSASLRIVWPIRRRDIELSSVERVEIVSARDLRAEFGFLARVGAGGLWGGFGMLWSSKGRHIDFYISRLGPMVLIHRRTGHPLLITPEQPERFVDALCAAAGHPAAKPETD